MRNTGSRRDRPVLIDVFCMAGTELYRAILEDVAGVHRRMPRERMRYALDIPYIARENSTAEILALKRPGHAPPDDHGLACREQPPLCGGWAPGSSYFSGLFLSWQLTHLPVSELPWPGAGGSG